MPLDTIVKRNAPLPQTYGNICMHFDGMGSKANALLCSPSYTTKPWPEPRQVICNELHHSFSPSLSPCASLYFSSCSTWCGQHKASCCLNVSRLSTRGKVNCHLKEGALFCGWNSISQHCGYQSSPRGLTDQRSAWQVQWVGKAVSDEYMLLLLGW